MSGLVITAVQWDKNPGPLDAVIAGTFAERLPTMPELVDATVFTLTNKAINEFNTYVDGGWMLM